MLAVNLSFSLLLILMASGASAAPPSRACGKYRATGILTSESHLVVNQGKQGKTNLALTGIYQRNARAGASVQIEGEVKTEMSYYEGSLEVSKLTLVVPDPLTSDNDELRLLRAKPCR